MTEKRKYPRHCCSIKTKYKYYTINPEEPDKTSSKPKKGKGYILDISKGGVFIVTSDRVNVGSEINLRLATKKNKYDIAGVIVRIGLLENNPSEVAKKFLKFAFRGDSYMAVEFNEPLEDLNEKDLF